MGGSASKTARRLPSAAPSRPPPPPSSLPPTTPAYSAPLPPAPRSASGPSTQYVRQGLPPSAPSASDRGRTNVADHGARMASMGAADVTGKSGPTFSGNKDAALLRDAQDPHFMANLSKLGQVHIQDAGKFSRTTSQAQRTLSARTPSLSSSDPYARAPPGHTDASTLVELLDALKTAPDRAAAEELYRQHGLEAAHMDGVRRWVNSISVGGEVRVTEGDEAVLKRTAVWVDGPTAPRAG